MLEVGTGSGYQAAVLSEVVTEGQVFTIEIVADLARAARKRLAALGYQNVVVHTGDGYLGLPENGSLRRDHGHRGGRKRFPRPCWNSSNPEAVW